MNQSLSKAVSYSNLQAALHEKDAQKQNALSSTSPALVLDSASSKDTDCAFDDHLPDDQRKHSSSWEGTMSSSGEEADGTEEDRGADASAADERAQVEKDSSDDSVSDNAAARTPSNANFSTTEAAKNESIAPEEPKLRGAERVMESTVLAIIMILATLYILYVDDFTLAVAARKTTNQGKTTIPPRIEFSSVALPERLHFGLLVLKNLAFLLFVFEFVLILYVRRSSYFGGFYFWLDLASIILLLPDVKCENPTSTVALNAAVVR